MVKKNVEKNAFKFICKSCDFYSNNNTDYNRHLQTKKHKGINGISDGIKKTQYICECGKIYKYQPGLSRHKKTCTYNDQEENITIEITEAPSTYRFSAEEGEAIREAEVDVTKEGEESGP